MRLKKSGLLIPFILFSVLTISCVQSGSKKSQSLDFSDKAAYTLENALVRFSVDEKGRLVELINKNTSTNYAGGGHSLKRE